jgi:hypothetical protein
MRRFGQGGWVRVRSCLRSAISNRGCGVQGRSGMNGRCAAAGLRWCDVDLDEGTAVICRQLQRRDGRLMVGPPKTVHSTRVIALDRTTVAALRTHRTRQRAEADACGDGYCDSGQVFTNRNGVPIAPGTLTHTFQRLIAERGVPPVRLHDLRHGAATLALALGAGVERGAEDAGGHSSIVLTADTYTSVLLEVAYTAAEQTAAYLLQAAGDAVHHSPPGPCTGPPWPPGSKPDSGCSGAALGEQPASRTGSPTAHPRAATGLCAAASRGFVGVIVSFGSLFLARRSVRGLTK